MKMGKIFEDTIHLKKLSAYAILISDSNQKAFMTLITAD